MTDSSSSRSSAIRRALAAVTALTLAGPLAACGSSDSKADTLAVSASFYPIQYLVQQIGGQHVTVTSVTPTNVEPHDFELSPKDVTSLSQAELITYVSGFQPSLDDAVAQVSGPTVVDLAEDVRLEHHDGNQDEGDTEHEHATGDPHFWLDPSRMESAATAIKEALAAADPDHAADYEANLTSLTSSLDALDSSYATGLSACERTTIVTSHAAFGYLTERYGLTQESISGVDPETEPSPADLAAVKRVVVETGTTTIFTEELVSPKTAEAVAAETGATTAVLSPLESAPDGGDYLSAMNANLEELRTALSCQ